MRRGTRLVGSGSTWVCWRDPAHATRTHVAFGWPVCADCGAKPGYPERFQAVHEGLAVDAAGRLVTAYPTTAMAVLPKGGLVQVGDFYPRERRLDVFDRPAVDAWLVPNA